MHETASPSDDNELSPEDLAVLQAFDEVDAWSSNPSTQARITALLPETVPVSAGNEMMTIFLSEAEEDISKMRLALPRRIHDQQHKPTNFITLKRAGHKLRGAAALMAFPLLSTLSQHVEVIAEQVIEGLILPANGSNALSQTVSVLEISLESLMTTGQELTADNLIVELEAIYQNLDINLEQSNLPAADSQTQLELLLPTTKILTPAPSLEPHLIRDGEPLPTTRFSSPDLLESILSPSSHLLHTHHFANLEQHTEQLQVQRAQLENAHFHVELALQELQAAQIRLQQLERLLPLFLNKQRPTNVREDHSTSSSLIDRILRESAGQNDHYRTHKNRYRYRFNQENNPIRWDELDMEHYTEKDTLVRSLREAIADVTVCSNRVNTAYLQLYAVQKDQTKTASHVYNDTLQLRLTSLNTLVLHLQEAISTISSQQKRSLHFEVKGATTEIDYSILGLLANPLLQLVCTCISNTDLPAEVEDEPEPNRIWLHVSSNGTMVTFEIGFSMTVNAEAVDGNTVNEGTIAIIRGPIQQLQGQLELQRNPTGGLSFILHVPRSRGLAHCLLVRTGSQYVIVPFTQIQRVGIKHHDTIAVLYHLHKMLGFPDSSSAPGPIHPVLILHSVHAHMSIGIAVDEVVGEVELVTKPLKAHLQRPGIAGAAVDGQGHVLLLLDLPDLVRHYKQNTHSPIWDDALNQNADIFYQPARQPQPVILVADDSVSMRYSIIQMLKQANYTVLEARDGMEAMELLRTHLPDLCLLDVEMPNLNGFGLLNMMHYNSQLTQIKVVMLTSRSSDKHRDYAFKLGASDYLIKPTPNEQILATIKRVLNK